MPPPAARHRRPCAADCRAAADSVLEPRSASAFFRTAAATNTPSAAKSRTPGTTAPKLPACPARESQTGCARPYNASVGLTPLGLLGGLGGAWRFACLCSALGLRGFFLLLRTNRIFLRRWIARRFLGLRRGRRPGIRCHCR